MIEIVYETGSLAGQRHSLSPGGDPEQYLHNLWKINTNWRLGYAEATSQEQAAWHAADVAVRIDRAFHEERPIYMNGFKCATRLQLVRLVHESHLTLNRLTIRQDHEDGLILEGT